MPPRVWSEAPKDTCNQASPAPVSDCCGHRQSGRLVLQRRIASLRAAADHLEAINNMLPLELNDYQDQALWYLANGDLTK
jgi:hypothetical protein